MERAGLCGANGQDHKAQGQRVGNSCLRNCTAALSLTVRKHDLRSCTKERQKESCI